jgi:hypothetical protein
MAQSMKTYTFEQLVEYIRSWSWADSDMQALTLCEIGSMLANASSQFECSQDGFEARCEYKQKQQEEKQ